MQRRRCFSLLVGAAAAAVAGGCTREGEDVPPPRIATVVPDRGPPGTMVTLTGAHFCQVPAPEEPEEVDEVDDVPPPCAPADGAVWFGTVSASSSILDDETASATVPTTAPGRVELYLSVAGRRSNDRTFTIEVL